MARFSQSRPISASGSLVKTFNVSELEALPLFANPMQIFSLRWSRSFEQACSAY